MAVTAIFNENMIYITISLHFRRKYYLLFLSMVSSRKKASVIATRNHLMHLPGIYSIDKR